ncbi:MAG TPA: isopeptide-forming domain-containing fimbrial protein, partial [Nakamurella sp.]
DGPAITGDVKVAAGQTVTVGPDPGDDIQLFLPVSSVCTLTEPLDTMPSLRDGAWTWGDPSFTVVGDIPTAGLVTAACELPPDGEPQVTPCLGFPPLFPARSVTVTIPRPQEDFPEPPTVGLAIDNPVLRSDGAYTVTKSSVPPSGSVVAPGDTITYTVTVNSTGAVPVHDVVVTDDMSSVLPYTTLGTITAPDGTSTELDGTNLVWAVGDVPNGQSRTLTYQATVNSGATGVTIKNLVTATGDVPPGTCADPAAATIQALDDDPDCSTTHTTPNPPTISKSPAGPPVFDRATGTWTVPYSIVVANPNADTAVPYTLTDNIAFPTDVPIVSGSVTSAPDGVALFDPEWNGSDQTVVAENVTLPGGASHTYQLAVVATVPLTLDQADLLCAATGSGGGSGFFNLASVSSLGTTSSDDACAPIPVMLVADKQWVIDGVAYANGDQPAGFSATLTLGGVEAVWRAVYVGFPPGSTVEVGENVVVPESCTTTSSSGTGETTVSAPLTMVTVTNVVDCKGPPPTTTPTSPTTTALTTLTTAYPPGPGPYPPLPDTGFAAEPYLFWGIGLLAAGAMLVLLAGWRRQRGQHG